MLNYLYILLLLWELREVLVEPTMWVSNSLIPMLSRSGMWESMGTQLGEPVKV